MKGITGDFKSLRTYEVEWEGSTFTIDNKYLASLDNFRASEDMVDFTDLYSVLSDLVAVYQKKYDTISSEVDKTYSQYFVSAKMPDNPKPRTDRTAENLAVLTLRSGKKKDLIPEKIQTKYLLNRLKGSLEIVDRAWNTARSLNANNRKEF